MGRRINLIYYQMHLFILCCSQVYWCLWPCGIPLPLPECFCHHPGDHSSSSLCPNVPQRCLPRDPSAADPSLSLSSALCLGNTPVLQAGYTYRPCQLSKSGDGQVCCSIVAFGENMLQKSFNYFLLSLSSVRAVIWLGWRGHVCSCLDISLLPWGMVCA